MSSTTINKLFDADEVRRGLELLLAPDQVTEVRALHATINGDRWPATYTGYYRDHEKLIESLGLIKSATAIYITPNPVIPALVARANERLKRADKGDSTSDRHIVKRRWLLIDCDAVRPAGVSATDAEHKAALQRIKQIADDLHYNYGWPEPIMGDSGNGGHLEYLIDEPAEDGGLIEKCLHAIAAKHSDEVVKVDTTVHNAARIWKLKGTLACKGDSTSDRPHRMSRILRAPETLQAVTHEQLETLAAEVPTPQCAETSRSANTAGDAFDVDGFIQRNGFDISDWHRYQGGRRCTFNRSPMCDHHDDGPFLIQFASGALSAGCHHESCNWGWADLRAAFEPKSQRQSHSHEQRTVHQEPSRQQIEVVKFGELYVRHPHLNPPVIERLLREGETCNLISNPKRGKSWTVYGMALSVICEMYWLGRFKTTRGKVLIVDNELHPCTLAHRIPVVAAEMGLTPSDYATNLEIISLRGNLQSLFDMEAWFESIPPGTYKLIIFDAMYRFCIDGVSENDNAAMAGFYNRLDRIAAMTNAALVLVHHASKGSQSEKRVTDVGSGAGAQSRAADCHLILREHEEDDIVVLDAAVRSFPPVEPVALRWAFPLWYVDHGADVSRLKGKGTEREERQNEQDREGIIKIVDAIRKDGAGTARQLRGRTGLSRERQQRLLDRMQSEGQLIVTKINIRGNDCDEYSLPKSEE